MIINKENIKRITLLLIRLKREKLFTDLEEMDEDSSSTLSLSFFHKMYTKITTINITRSIRNIEAICNQLMFNVCGTIVTCICILGMNSNTCYDKGDEQNMKITLNLKTSDEMDFRI